MVAPVRIMTLGTSSLPPPFIPNWGLNMESQANIPDVVAELMLKTVMPKDAEYIIKLSFKKLTDLEATSVATVSSFYI